MGKHIRQANIGSALLALILVGLVALPFPATLSQSPTPTAPSPQEPEDLATPTVPDLVAQITPPTDLGAASTVLIQTTITNNGGPSEATTAQVVLRSETGSEPLRTIEIPALAAGETHADEFTWSAPTGLTRLQVLTDPENKVGESSESNNVATTWVQRAYPEPVNVDQPLKFETRTGEPAQEPNIRSSWDDGVFRVSVRPKGNTPIVALVHKDWLDSRLAVSSLENASYTITEHNGAQYYAFDVPAGQTSEYTARPFEPRMERTVFGQGSMSNVLLGERPMKVRILDEPRGPAARETIQTPNGTVEVDSPAAIGTRLSLDFQGESHEGQPVWLRAAWLEAKGIENPAARHEDGTPVSMKRVGNFWLLEPDHFSIVHVFNQDAEVFSKVSPQTNSEVSWDPNGGNGRMKIVSNRVDTLDESMVRNFVPHSQYFVTADFGITTQGNWQAMYPLIFANRAERTNPSGSDNYAAPGSFGFFYYSRDDYSNAPQIQAYYYPVGGSKQTVWTWSAPTGVYDGWSVLLRIDVGATQTTFTLYYQGSGPSVSVSNSLLPMSNVDVISFGSEDLDVDSSEAVSVGWVDGIFVVPVVGNRINQEFDSSSGWTLDGSPAATCCSGSYLQLTDNAGSQAGRAYYNLGMNAARFSAEFAFYVGPNSGGADGLTFFFYKNLGYTPANGGSLGYGDSNTGTTAGHEGYAIAIDTYANTWPNGDNDPAGDYVGFLRNDVDQHVAGANHVPSPSYINGQFNMVNVEVWDNTIAIYYSQRLVYYNTESFSRTYSGIGFSAGTGGLTNYHRIDYLRVSSMAQANSPPPTPGLISPTNGQTGVSTSPTLNWQAVTDPDPGNTVNYLVYFGVNAPSSSPYANPTSNSYPLSGLLAGTQYCWRVVAQDNLGAQSPSSSTWCFTTASAPPPGTGISQNWDSGTGSWTFTASSADPNWHRVSRSGRYVSPSYALWYGRDSTMTYDNGATNYGSATSPSFGVQTTNPVLKFRTWVSTEGGGYYDRRDVLITTNGGSTWNCLASSYSMCRDTTTGTPAALTTTEGSWMLENIGLGTYSGQTVMLRFTFSTGDSISNAWEGWYIDDVVVETAAANQAPSTPSAPIGPTSGIVGTPYAFSATASDDGATVRYLFDWGDGTINTYSPYVNQGTSGSATHTWTSAGTWWVRAKAEDSATPALQSASWSASVSITISAANSPPTACINNPSWAADGLTITVTSCSTDPDPGDTAALAHTWNWGDGTPTSSGASPPPHTYACPGGGFVITLTVSDGKASPVSTTKSVTANPPDPDADGLKSCQETTYSTNPNVADTDGDGANDGTELSYWNTIGPTAWNVNYRPYGGSTNNNLLTADSDMDGLKDGFEFQPPTSIFCGSVCEAPAAQYRDVYVEVDWMVPQIGPAYKLSASHVSTMENLFSLHSNMRLHIDQGELGGGSQVPYDQVMAGDSAPSSTNDDWDRLYNNDLVSGVRYGFKDGHLASPPRRAIYHYAVMAHFGPDNCPLFSDANYGLSGSDMIVINTGCINSKNLGPEPYVYATFMHELGHQLWGDIEPISDRDTPHGNGHDIYSTYLMWWFKNSATDYHYNRWNCVGNTDAQCDMDDTGDLISTIPTSGRRNL